MQCRKESEKLSFSENFKLLLNFLGKEYWSPRNFEKTQVTIGWPNRSKFLRRSCSPIGHNNTKHFFVPNQEPAFAWPFGNGPVRVGTQGLFRLCLKTFVASFKSALTDRPWTSEDDGVSKQALRWLCELFQGVFSRSIPTKIGYELRRH